VARTLLAGDALNKHLGQWLSLAEGNEAPWERTLPAKGLVRLSDTRPRWFQVTCIPLEGGILCMLGEVTAQYTQTEALRTGLGTLSELLGQPHNLPAQLQTILKTAIEVVPGAEGGSISLLEGEVFRLAAQIGFRPELIGWTTRRPDLMNWHGLGELEWLAGTPRLLKAPEIQTRSNLSAAGSLSLFAEYGRLEELKANLSVPVALSGEVLAVLDLDAFSATEAFGPESLEIARSFALQAATVLYSLLSQHSLTEMALTDSLTGLGNRHALEIAFPKLQAQARRLFKPLCLIYWDMDGLKTLNDNRGHAAGDQALKDVADALQRGVRQSDMAFRIGGDEFVSLHLGVGLDQVAEVVARIRRMMLHQASAGAALVEAHQPLEAALSQADTAMYGDKSRNKQA
jgi:diguanylate cyclase (GGDEF)-like protein